LKNAPVSLSQIWKLGERDMRKLSRGLLGYG
jgi:phage FluMu protein gp41